MSGNLGRLWKSIVGMKTWVKIWLVILASTNMLSFAFLNTDTGWWTMVAFMLIGCFNMPTMVIQGGLTRLLSLPHFIWLPLLIYIYPKILGANALSSSSPEYHFAWAIFVVDGISLLFDALESARWIHGQREILGLPATA